MNKNSGMQVRDYIVIYFEGTRFVPGTDDAEHFSIPIAIQPDGAVYIVDEIADLVNGPPPPDMQLPGTN